MVGGDSYDSECAPTTLGPAALDQIANKERCMYKQKLNFLFLFVVHEMGLFTAIPKNLNLYWTLSIIVTYTNSAEKRREKIVESFPLIDILIY